MKGSFCTLFVALLLNLQLNAQRTAIDVADNTLKVPAFGEEIFYYGFAEGDKVIFNFEELKGKELKEIEIIEMPAQSKFMDYKTKKIENKTLEITKTGVYKFRFANTGLGGRICKFKIQRIPATETSKNFNCSVYWRTVFDTIQRTEQERYLISQQYKTVQLLEPSQYYINSGSHATWKGGKSRITMPVILPKNTVEWYYTFSATRNEQGIDAAKKSLNLMRQLTTLVAMPGILNIGIGMLTTPPGGNVCDVFLLDAENRNPFEEKLEYRFKPEGSRENITSGVVKIKSSLFQVNYLGIRNPDASYGVHIVIEAVAITMEEKWDVRDVIKYDVSSRQEAYLKN